MAAETFSPSLDLQESYKTYDPLEYLIAPSKPTEIHDVYEMIKPAEMDPLKPIVFIVIGPSGAGKDTLVDHLIAKNLVQKATTATSRLRRDGEPEDAYVWMRPRREDETEESYYEHLIEEYDLLEHDGHHGSVYGLPRQSLDKDKKIPLVIRTENKGLRTIQRNLGDDYNIVSIFIVPDNYEILQRRIEGRGNLELRMTKSVEEVKDARGSVNFVILNGDHPEDERYYGDSALRGKVAIQKLVMELSINHMEA